MPDREAVAIGRAAQDPSAGIITRRALTSRPAVLAALGPLMLVAGVTVPTRVAAFSGATGGQVPDNVA